MRKLEILLAVALTVLTVSVHQARAAAPSDGPDCVIPKLDLDKVPFPLKTANTKFELAEGETYILNGRVIKKDGSYFFQIDFESQPWLATQTRVQNPFIAIDPSDSAMIAKYGNGELVQMAVLMKKLSPTVSLPAQGPAKNTETLGIQVIAN